jgi:hypothetical protein
MNRLSNPEIILKKIEDISGQIDGLCKTVDLARRVKENIEVIYENAVRYETHFKQKSSAIDALEASCGNSARQLEELTRTSETRLSRLAEALETEKLNFLKAVKSLNEQSESRFSRMLKAFELEKTTALESFDDLRGQSEKRFSRLIEEVESEKIKTRDATETAQVRVSQMVEEGRHAVEEMALAETRFETRLTRVRDLETTHRNLVQDLKEIGQRLEIDRSIMLSDIDISRFNLQELSQVFSNQQAEVQEQYQDLVRQVSCQTSEITGRMACFMEDAETRFRQRHFQTLQDLHDEREVIRNETERLALFSTQLTEEIEFFQEGLENFKWEIQKTAHRKIRDLDRENKQFRDIATAEMRGQLDSQINTLKTDAAQELKTGLDLLKIMADLSGREFSNILTEFEAEKEKGRRAFSALEIRTAEIQKTHDAFASQISQSMAAASAQMSYLDDHISQSLKEIRIDANQTLDENTKKLKEQMDRLTLFSTQTHEEIEYLGDSLEIFRQQTWNAVRQKLSNISEQQRIFRKSVEEDIGNRFASEIRKMTGNINDHTRSSQMVLEQETARLNSDVQTRMESVQTRMDQAIQEIIEARAHQDEKIVEHTRSSQMVLEQETTRLNSDVQARMESVKRQMDQAIQEITDHTRSSRMVLEQETARLNSDVQTRMESVKRQMDQAIQEITDQTRSSRMVLEQETARLNSDVQARMDQTIQEITDQTRSSRMVLEQETARLNSDVQARMKSVKSQMDQTIQEIIETSARQDEKITEHTRSSQMVLEQETARLHREVQTHVELADTRIDQVIEEMTEIKDRQIEAFGAFMGEAGSRIEHLEKEVTRFKNQTSDRLIQESKALGQRQTAFEETAIQNLKDQFSRETQDLRSDNKKSFTEFMAAVRQENSRLEENVKTQVQERLDWLSAFGEDTRRKFFSIQEDFRALGDQIKAEIQGESAAMLQKQTEFEEIMSKKIEAALSQEVRRANSTLQISMKSFSEREKELTASFKEEAQRIEKRLADMRAEQEKQQAEIQNRVQTHDAQMLKQLKEIQDVQEDIQEKLRLQQQMEQSIQAVKEDLGGHKDAFRSGQERIESLIENRIQGLKEDMQQSIDSLLANKETLKAEYEDKIMVLKRVLKKLYEKQNMQEMVLPVLDKRLKSIEQILKSAMEKNKKAKEA